VESTQERGKSRTLAPRKATRINRVLPLREAFILYQPIRIIPHCTGTISNSILSSSLTLTVPPAMRMGSMPKSLCLIDAEPR
jgi:hypothetical protein